MPIKLPLDGILLVSDMDGTLVTGKFDIPERNIEAAERFVQKGGRFTLATGRSSVSAGLYLDMLPLNAPAILLNGAAIYDYEKKEYLWSYPLPEACWGIVRKTKERFPGIGIEAYIGSDIYILSENEFTRRHVNNERFKARLASFESLPPGSLKVLFAGENSMLHRLREYLRGLHPSDVDFFFSGETYFEFISKGVSKGKALLRLSEILGIDRGNTVAIGDYDNDYELVKLAGLGVAVKEATREIRDVAQLVVGGCENGAVADLIEIIEKAHNC